MNPNTPAVKYNYEFFLFTRLALSSYLTQTEDMECDHMFVVLIDLYEDFLKSGYNNGYKNLYECYEDYFRNLVNQ